MDQEPKGRDKRRFERITITDSKSIWNLGEGGAYIATDRPRRLGSLLHFEFKLGKNGPNFKALAKVIRVLHKPNPKIGEPAGMAIQFVTASDEDRNNLKNYLSTVKHSRDLPNPLDFLE